MGSCPSRVWPTRTSARCGGSPRGAQRREAGDEGPVPAPLRATGRADAPWSGRDPERLCRRDPRRAFYARLECRGLVGDGRAVLAVNARLEPSEECAVPRAGYPTNDEAADANLQPGTLWRMARPGLEPGTPRFSVVRSKRLTYAKSWKRCALRPFGRSGGCPHFAEVCRRFGGWNATHLPVSLVRSRIPRRRSLRVSPGGRDTDRRRRHWPRPPATSTQVRSRRESSRSQRLLRRHGIHPAASSADAVRRGQG